MSFSELLRSRSQKSQPTTPAPLRIRALGLVAVLIVISGALLEAQGQCVATVDRTVKICSPTAGSTVASPVQFTAAALDNEHPVTAMKLYVDTIKSATSASAQLSASVSLASGSHHIT